MSLDKLWDQNWELEDYVQSTDVAPLQSRLFAWIHSQMSRIADVLIALLQRCRDSKYGNRHHVLFYYESPNSKSQLQTRDLIIFRGPTT